MGKIFAFLLSNRSFVLFLALQSLAIWLLVNKNDRYNASVFNSSNYLATSVNQHVRELSDYISLKQVNQQLVLENEALRLQVLNQFTLDSTINQRPKAFVVKSAKIIDNTYRRGRNFFTIDKGRNDTVAIGMGVLSPMGIAGQVKAVSENYATCYSILHPNISVSSLIKRTGTVCTTQWDQKDFQKAKLRFIPRHVSIHKGDTIVTSGFNSVYPENQLIGIVEEFTLSDEMTFYEATVKLFTDFTSLNYVYLIEDLNSEEIDSVKLL